MIEVEHYIQLIYLQPIVTRPRHYTAEQERQIKKEVDQIIKDDIIEPSNSPFSSEVVLAKKAIGEWRFCVAFRD